MPPGVGSQSRADHGLLRLHHAKKMLWGVDKAHNEQSTFRPMPPLRLVPLFSSQLSLRINDIGDVGTEELAKALAVNNTLTYV